MNELITVKRTLLRESLLVGVLTALDAFMFVAFSRAVFGNTETPVMVLFLALAGFMVANVSRKIRLLGKPKSPTEELLRLQKELKFITGLQWVLLGLLPLLAIGALISQQSTP